MDTKRPVDYIEADLLVDHAEELSALFSSEPSGYTRFFHPFKLDRVSIQSELLKARNDVYRVLLSSSEIAGLYMLRGLDEGFSIPSLGMYVSSAHSGRGLGRRLLASAVDRTRDIGANALRLSVYRSNQRAFELYEQFGFKVVNVEVGDEKGDVVTMKLKLNERDE